MSRIGSDKIIEPRAHVGGSLGPHPLAFTQALVEVTALPDHPPDGGWKHVQAGGCAFDLGLELLGKCLHDRDHSVKDHTLQRETSHSRPPSWRGKFHIMDASETFRANLLRIIAERGLTEAQVSVAAGLNRRAVTDIRERRTSSPKLSTVMALAGALAVDAGELMGLGRRYRLDAALADFLEQYSEADQARFLAALAAFPRLPS